MKKQSVLFLTALAAIMAATFFAVRQRTLNEVRSGNESFRQQMETPGNGAGSEAVAETAATHSAAALSAEEKAELLRLRGQVPSLRNEASEASNRVASLSQPRTPVAAVARPGPSPADQRRMVFDVFMHTPHYQSANNLAYAVRDYMLQHAGKIPEDLAAVPPSGNRSFSEETVKGFELIRTGSIPTNSDMAPFVLIAREKEPVQLQDGSWVRLYMQANGGVTVAGPLPNKPPLEDEGFIRQSEEIGKRILQQRKESPPR